MFSGANVYDNFVSSPTSYDYEGLLDEAGDPTSKYFSYRTCIGKVIIQQNLYIFPYSRDVKTSKAAFLGTNKHSFAIISPWYLESIKIWRRPLLAGFPANSAVF